MNVTSSATARYWLQLLEKVVFTWLEAYLGLMLIDPFGLNSSQKAAFAAIPAALSVLTAGITIPAGLPYVVDLAARVMKTGVQTFIAALLAAPVFSFKPEILEAAWGATLPAMLAVLKGGVARFVGQESSAALLPASVDKPVAQPGPTDQPVAP